MAGSRRGRSRGISASELRGTLGSLIRSTLAQAGVVRDVLERGAREGRARLDDVRLERQRADALADLGEAVLAAIRRGELADLEELPEIAHAVAAIEELELRLDHDQPHRDRDDDRRRDDRRRHREDVITGPRTPRPRDAVGDAPWQRVRDDEPHDHFRDPLDADEVDGEERGPARRSSQRGDRDSARGDGTVSSAEWKPPRPAAPQRVWRPVVEDIEPEPPASPDRPATKKKVAPPAETRPASEPKARRGAARAGGITFEDDDAVDDLQDYMHPDDVPPREPKK